jgi:predicted membrane protein
MFSKIMKITIPFVVATVVIYLYVSYVTSFDLAIKYSVFPLILAFLFYYDFTLAVIATVLFSAVFVYNMKYSKKVNYRKKTSKFKINDNVDNEYDYVNDEELLNDAHGKKESND